MRIDRRDFLKLGTLGTLGLITIPSGVVNPVPMQINTYYGRLLFNQVKYHGLPAMPHEYWNVSSLEKIPLQYSEHKAMMKLDDEFVKTKGMELLTSTSRITDEERIDVRDAEIVNRVMDQAALIEIWKDRYPSSWQWSEGDIRMDIFHYLVKELERLNPDNKDFSEGYTNILVKKLIAAVPNERFDSRMDYYHNLNRNKISYFLPGQIGAPVIFDKTDKKLNRNSKTTVELYCYNKY